MTHLAMSSLPTNSVIALILVCTGLVAQDTAPAGPTAPVRSVAVVVDVSGSVSAPFALEARNIIQSIVSGRGFQTGNGWVCNYDAPEPVDPAGEDTWPEDETIKSMFQPYWSGTGGPRKPLTAAGKVFQLALCGTLQTTMNPPRTWDLGGPQEFEALMQQEYPSRADQFRDMRTCYYIATARTADRLLQRSEEGCYLFVVSDEWDDPDSKHSPVDEWMPHLEKWGIYDTRYQSAMVSRFRELKESDRFNLIARFHKGDRPKRTGGSKTYLRVAWYAIGEKPKPVEPPPKPAVPPKPDDPPPPEPPKPPAFGRSLTLLGGLIQATDPADSAKPDASRIKVFTHSEPFLAWQVEGTSANSVDSQFEVTIHRLDSSNTLQSVQKLRSAQLNRTTEGRLRGLPAGTVTQPLTDGTYRITIEEKPAAGTTPAAGSLLGPIATWIEVQTPFNWLPWLLSVSAVAAAGVIGYSVWSLRK